jgi:hypothetical protein
MDRLLKLLAVIVIIVLAVLIIFRGIAALRNHKLSLKDRLKRMLDALRNALRRKKRAAGPVAADHAIRHAPLSSFRNPFGSEGELQKMSPDEAARYTYQAVLALTREWGVGRRDEETPLEYARRMDRSLPQIRLQVQNATQVYTRVEYACKPLDSRELEKLRQLWEFLEAKMAASVQA